MRDTRSDITDITEEIVESIKNDLKKFDIVLAFVGSKDRVTEWMTCFHKSKAAENTLKRILILSDIDISGINSCAFEYHTMNEKEWNVLERLYAMYDFSDHFFVISDKPQYGGLMNYAKTGVMTMEEIFQTVLL